MPLFRRDVTSISKSGSAKIKGDSTLSAGTNVTLTQVGQDIQIASTGGTGAGDAIKKSFTQVAHGLSTGEAVELDTSGNWIKADASDTSKLGVGIVSTVEDTDTLEVTFAGYISGLSGLTTGEYHFVSSTTPGSLTPTKPSFPNAENPILLSLSTTTGIVLPYRPSLGGTIIDGGNFTESSTDTVDGGSF